MNKLGNVSNSNRLQIENQRMEERLRTLKKVMAVEKAHRSDNAVQSGEGRGHWKSSHVTAGVHSLSNKTNEVAKPNPVNQKKKRVTILTGKEQEPQTNKVSCGQCDQYKASIACVECIENYCTVCFTKFHHKGALSNHRVRPLTTMMIKECSKPATASTGSGKTSSSTGVQHDLVQQDGLVGDHQIGSTSLLEGMYNEEQSSRSFHEALLAWRKGNEHTEQKDVETASVQTTDSRVGCTTATVAIQFNTRLSYMERLLLKRKRSDPSFLKIQLSHLTEANPRVQEEITSPSPPTSPIISGHNLFYSPSNTTMTIVDYCIEKGNIHVASEEKVQPVSIHNNHNHQDTDPNSSCSPQEEISQASSINKSMTSATSNIEPSSNNSASASINVAMSVAQRQQYKGLSSFFLMGTTHSVDPSSVDSDLDINTTPLPSYTTTWQPDSSIPCDEYITQSDLPPHCLSLPPPTHRSNDSTLYDETLASCDDQSLDEEDKVLEDLADELRAASRVEHDRITTNEDASVDCRALSRMTIKELVQDFEEYQAQVINEDMCYYET